jgi:hypothetical protein
MKKLGLAAVIFGLLAMATLGAEGTIIFQGGHGAKAYGMGGAFVALADDATGALWNPAGLARIQGLWVGGATATKYTAPGFEGVPYQFASLGTTFEGFGVGLSWAMASAGELYSANAFIGTIALSFPLGEGFEVDVGFNAKYYMESLDGDSYNTFSFDVGLIVPIADTFSIGFAALDIAAPDISPVYRAGLAFSFLEGAAKLALDVVMVDMDLDGINFGLGLKLIEMLELRAGAMVPGTDFQNASFTVGAGLVIADLSVDAAYVLQGEPGDTLVISLSYAFSELFAPAGEEVGTE